MNTSKNDDKRLTEIQNDLKEIKKMLKQSERKAQSQWLYNIGFARYDCFASNIVF